MLHGSVPRSIVRALAGSPVEPNYAPDGLTEQTIDDLIDELRCRVAVLDPPNRRWERRWTRQDSTAAALLLTGTGVAVGAGEVA